MTSTEWIAFDRSKPETFPPQDRELLVETERGQTFPARFIEKSRDFSLKWALWGNQGAVVRWRYAGNDRDAEKKPAHPIDLPTTGTS